MRVDRRYVALAVAFVLAACGGDGRTLDPGAVGDDVVIKVAGTVVAASDLSPLADASVWVDVETPNGSDVRATDRTSAEGRFAMVFTEKDCSVATEFAFRMFARKKGFRDGEITSGSNGGLPVLKCVTSEQEIAFHLTTQ